MQEWTMTVRSRLPILIAEYNLTRLRAGQPKLGNPEIAEKLGIEYTRLHRLLNGSQAWKFDVMDACMQLFELNSFDQLFEYTEELKK